MTSGAVAYYYRLMQVCQVSALPPSAYQQFRPNTSASFSSL
ncbi:hypothetical protein BS78_10G147400 [Paspalum vaginatum]|nr:hypothetical protein BS78_10G147400 [Paspalum vaginatum]